MAQASILKCRGLYTFQNNLSEIPEGALVEADNVVIDRDGVISPRRGLALYGTPVGDLTTDRAKQLFIYKNRVFRHWGTQIDYDSDGNGAFLPIATSVSQVDDILRIKSLESNGNLYLTTSSGIKKISVASASDLFSTYEFTLSSAQTVGLGAVYKDGAGSNFTVLAATTTDKLQCSSLASPVGSLTKQSGTGPSTLTYISVAATTNTSLVSPAGGIKALDLSAALDIDKPGFFSQDSVCAYRLVWGITDANNNLILGVPSELVTVYNSLLASLIQDFTDLCSDLDAAAIITSTDALSDINYSSLASSVTTPPLLHSKMGELCGKLDTDLSVRTFYGKTGSITAIEPAYGSAEITSAGHTLSLGDKVVLKNTTSTPSIDGEYTITQVPTYYTFTITTANAVATEGSVYQDGASNKFTVRRTISGGVSLVCTGPNAPAASGSLTKQSGPSTDTSPIAYSAVATSTDTFRIAASVDSSGAASGSWQQQSIYTRYATAPTSNGTNEELKYLQEFYNAVVDELNITPSFTISGLSISGTTLTVTTSTNHGLNNSPKKKVRVVSSSCTPAITGEYEATVLSANTFTITLAQTVTIGAPPITGSVFVKTYSLSRESAQVNLTFTIPEGITTKHFYQLYRSPLKSADGVVALTSLDAGLDLQLAVQDYPTQIQIAAKTITIQDDTAQDFLGANLYTNPNSGEGIAYSNEAPPVAKDIALFKNSVFYANTTVKHRKNFSLLTGLDTLLGKKFIIGRSDNPLEEVAFTFVSSGTSEGQVIVSTSDTVAQRVDETARALVRAINNHSQSKVYAYYVSGPSDIPGAILLEDRQLGRPAFYIRVNDASISDVFDPSLPLTNTEKSDSEVNPNRVYFSKYQQPESVPLVNYFDIGPKDKKIIRVLALRDSLFVIKEDGIYRVTGEFGQFQVSLFDSSSKCIAPDTATVLNNQIYMFSNQGVTTISDTGVSVLSRPIENQLLRLTSHDYTNLASASFAVPYESDRAYLLWTVEDANDTFATQCFRYNTFTSTWTRWSISKTCGVVSPEDDRVYLGAADTNFVERERKNFTRLDYADREFTFSLPVNAVSGSELSLGGFYGMEAGDVLVQIQYLTISQFNRLLKKLDQDTGTVDQDYYSTLKASPGQNLFERFGLLVTKLNNDAGTTSTYVSTNTTNPQTLQSEFNAVIAQLNADPTVSFTDYVTSTGTVEWEAPILNLTATKIILSYTVPLITGDCVYYKHIKSSVTWAPQHFGDPSITKQVRETTMVFETNAFLKASASYASDLSTGFVSVPFLGEGSGNWGNFVFGEATWGGEGTSKPLRTYIPREKQRCRYLTAKFQHSAAFENYAILGLSFTFESVGSRGYR